MMFYGNTYNQIESEIPIQFEEKSKTILFQIDGKEYRVPQCFCEFDQKIVPVNQRTIKIETWFLKKHRIIHL